MKTAFCNLWILAALVHGTQATGDVQDESPRKLDAVRGTPMPTKSPTTSPTKSPTTSPTVSHQPSLSLEPTRPYQECDGQLPFCWDGQGYGWGYTKCFAIESTEHCTSYDFQIAGTNYSTSEIIDFSHCASVWWWFTHCIEYSFPTCVHLDTGSSFNHKTYTNFYVRKKTYWNQPTKWQFQMSGSSESCYAEECNSGTQYWNCDEEDDAKAMLAFAKWVAGYRDGKKTADSLFVEPDNQCATAAPTSTVAPTSSPAPTYDIAPSCSSLDQPEWVSSVNNTESSNTYYMNYYYLNGHKYAAIAQSSTCYYKNGKTGDTFSEPLPWILDAAEKSGGTLSVDDGKLNGVSLNSSTVVLEREGDTYSVTIQESEALVGGNLTWVFDKYSQYWKNRQYATYLYDFLVKTADNYPLIWQTDIENDLYCGSGAFCYDQNPHVRSYVQLGSDNCGKYDFMIDGGESGVSSTGDVIEWFMDTAEMAFGCEVVSTGNFLYKNDAWLSRWYDSGANIHYVKIGSSGTSSAYKLACKTEEASEMLEDFFYVVENARLFGTKVAECTEPPTPSPTACTDSFFTNPPLNILLVVDTSYSTYEGTFETPVGDQNNDGKADTIMDAEIAAAKALLNTIIETEELNNDNVNIGLVLFDTEARYIGNFNPTTADGTAIDEALLAALTSISIETDPNVVIDTNLGFTNMDDALDKAILYFEDESLPDYGSNPTNLMVFMGDGKPNVRGDGDGETSCTGVSDCEGVPADLVDASLPAWEQSPLSFCTSGDTSCDASPYKKCVLGETCLDDSQTKQYDSELARLDEFKVHRLSIGVGDQSDVSVGSALWIIDNNEMKITHGLLPRQVMDADDLITALADLCPENTPNPTRMPSASPTDTPTTSPTSSPTKVPSASPTTSPSASPTVDFCEYNVIDFETLSDGETPVTSGYAAFPLEWEAYGLSVRAQPYDEAEESSPVAARYQAVETEEYTGMTLVVPQEDASNGGDLIITLDQTQEKGMELYIWNAVEGGVISVLNTDGEELSTKSINDREGEMQIIQVAVAEAYAIVISFSSEGALAQLNVCRDPSSTPAPIGLAPPSGSLETRAPTDSPTGTATSPPTSSPTTSPSSGPTASPSSGPTGSPTSAPTDTKVVTCPEDIKLQLVTPESGTALEFIPLTIVERGATTVTLELTKSFSESVSYVYVEYVDGRTQECIGIENFLTTSTERFTAECMELAPITIVNLYVSDPSVVAGDAEIPECCHHPEEVTYPVVEYTFKVYCEPQCPERM